VLGAAPLFAGFALQADGSTGVAMLEFVDGGGLRLPRAPAVVESAAAALRWLSTLGPPAGVGLNAPLSWTLGAGGVRPQDVALRERFASHAELVPDPESLPGAIVTRGPAVALHVAREWPAAVLAESHPRLAMAALGVPTATLGSRAYAARRAAFFALGQVAEGEVANAAGLDAVVAAMGAWAAWASAEGWRDLNALPRCGDLAWPCGRAVRFPFPADPAA
jgi:hypothetical protein